MEKVLAIQKPVFDQLSNTPENDLKKKGSKCIFPKTMPNYSG
jgi:hypothetical protein